MTSVALTIAGSDSGGGAGIQADLKTFQELGVFGTSALTAVTAQNTLGVHGVYPIEAAGVTAQIQAVLDDFSVGAVKTGMLFSADIIEAVAVSLRNNGCPPLVIDPVMIAKGGASLLKDEAVTALKAHLLPLATLVTPNIPEAEVLADMTIQSTADYEEAANRILSSGAKAVILKGGHSNDAQFAEDFFFRADGYSFTIKSERIATKDTHGTGCTFSAAITAFISQGKSLQEAVREAKVFIQAAISDGLQLGGGHGPTNHWAYNRLKQDAKEVVIIE
ncbi:bifunctional hydroxymethylpyrimidine kinase/phosphomethylpyrimidine kinase [Sporosarcina saromensis]|uniref:Hydroxymethylpyrimidine/phosphomethylpyrimidine kinase n=1 Tax=Sporosarcina saromensis TaxID=359365 RepID=A0ABU4G8Z0_9BACL|nr:bifunctional hydroxymethylpyrimidine kinase/phosphomethylpyrimidine kinase [Sporosarcina saromensis]MDW0113449.1 bifunctional hydroxymethylpyrimidine kinase/phosphomethylpyrimidine kinase [Sporosarcina saromensis]